MDDFKEYQDKIAEKTLSVENPDGVVFSLNVPYPPLTKKEREIFDSLEGGPYQAHENKKFFGKELKKRNRAAKADIFGKFDYSYNRKEEMAKIDREEFQVGAGLLLTAGIALANVSFVAQTIGGSALTAATAVTAGIAIPGTIVLGFKSSARKHREKIEECTKIRENFLISYQKMKICAIRDRIMEMELHARIATRFFIHLMELENGKSYSEKYLRARFVVKAEKIRKEIQEAYIKDPDSVLTPPTPREQKMTTDVWEYKFTESDIYARKKREIPRKSVTKGTNTRKPLSREREDPENSGPER